MPHHFGAPADTPPALPISVPACPYPNPKIGDMTPAQEFNAYLPQALAGIGSTRASVRQIHLDDQTIALLRRLNKAAWRLRRYSIESESGTQPGLGAALAQAEGYCHMLDLALDDAELLLDYTNNNAPNVVPLAVQIAEQLLVLYRTPVPTFPDRLNHRNAWLETAP